MPDPRRIPSPPRDAESKLAGSKAEKKDLHKVMDDLQGQPRPVREARAPKALEPQEVARHDAAPRSLGGVCKLEAFQNV